MDIEAEKPRGKFDFGGNLHKVGKQKRCTFWSRIDSE